MKCTLFTASVSLVLVFAAMPLPAHHSPAAEYDTKNVVTMQGVVTEFLWTNPHAYVLVDVADSAGKAVNWKVELPSPNTMGRRGLKKTDANQGDRVAVDVWLAKDGSHLADARTITLADGRAVSCASQWDNPLPLIFNQSARGEATP